MPTALRGRSLTSQRLASRFLVVFRSGEVLPPSSANAATGMRWTVEFFHDVVKNGGSQEDRRFKTAGRRETCRALRSLVAVRVLRRRRAREHLPEEPAEEVATAAEIGLIR